MSRKYVSIRSSAGSCGNCRSGVNLHFLLRTHRVDVWTADIYKQAFKSAMKITVALYKGPYSVERVKEAERGRAYIS